MPMNAQIASHQLPDYREVVLEPVAPRYLSYAVLVNAAFWLIVVVGLLVWQRLPLDLFDVPDWALVFPATLLLVSVLWSVLDARGRRWALREHDLLYHSGVLWHKTVILPFARIQHVETASGPLERWFGLMRVKCFTAGGMTTDLTVVGLRADDARRVRQYLLEQIR
jgi:membrane protein YdbS with pleckstrin-like domain